MTNFTLLNKAVYVLKRSKAEILQLCPPSCYFKILYPRMPLMFDFSTRTTAVLSVTDDRTLRRTSDM